MHRYYAHIGKTYRYHNKKDLISDLCEALQSSKKEYMSGIHAPLLFNRNFELLDNNRPHLELWKFQIVITDHFEVKKCILEKCNDSGTLMAVQYCYSDGTHFHDTFRNITEFREFLNREIDKEDS